MVMNSSEPHVQHEDHCILHNPNSSGSLVTTLELTLRVVVNDRTWGLASLRSTQSWTILWCPHCRFGIRTAIRSCGPWANVQASPSSQQPPLVGLDSKQGLDSVGEMGTSTPQELVDVSWFFIWYTMIYYDSINCKLPNNSWHQVNTKLQSNNPPTTCIGFPQVFKGDWFSP